MAHPYRDLKYSEFFAWLSTFKYEFPVFAKPPHLKNVGMAFSANFLRLTSLAGMPYGLVLMATKHQLALDVATFKLYGRVERTASDFEPSANQKLLDETNRILRGLKRLAPPG